MDEHLGCVPYEHSKNDGVKTKMFRSNYGELEVNVTQDRQSSF